MQVARRFRNSGSVGLLPLLLGIGLTVASCAENGALEQDVAQLRQDVNQLLLNAHRNRGEAEALSQLERVTREQGSESARQMSALSSRIESINSELTRLAARVDQTSQRLDNLGQRIEALSRPVVPVVPLAPSAGVPPRSQPPASPPAMSAAPPPVTAPSPPPPSSPSASPTAASPQAAAPVPSPSPGPPSPGVAATPPSTAASAEAAYQAAYLDFSKGNFALAIPAFREFVRRFPDSPLADSAQYAIGESHFSMARAASTAGQPDKAKEELEQAVQEFRKVIVNYPRGSKVPTALYKEALALAELKQTALAQARLEYLLQHFPQSEEAPLAKERLAALKQ
jgi:tol-pal system protein YbgF